MGWMILGQDRKLSEKSKQEQLVADRKRAMNEIRDRPALISFPMPLNTVMVWMTASMSFDCTSPAGGQSRFLSAFEHELEDPCIKSAYGNRRPITSACTLRVATEIMSNFKNASSLSSEVFLNLKG